MINDNAVEFYNSRLTTDYTNIQKLSVSQQDKLRQYGSQAENLLKNKDLAMFIHHYKFEVADALASIRGHSLEDNTQRIAMSNELAGIDNFISSLKKAVYLKNKLGNVNVDAQV